LYVLHTREVTVESYFFGGRNIHWVVIGLSLLTACFFSPYLFGLLITRSTTGIIIIYLIVSTIMLILLGWFVAPLFMKLNISTLPDYFGKRYNKNSKLFLSALYIFYNIFIRLVTILALGNLFIQLIAGIDSYPSILFFLVITSIYVMIGGLQTEIYVNTLQVLFISLGIIVFATWLFKEKNGFEFETNRLASFYSYNEAANMDYSLRALIFGLPILGFWFWCADQFIVQKVLSATKILFVRKAVVVTGLLQIVLTVICILSAITIVNFSKSEASTETLNALFLSSSLPGSLRMGFIITVAAVLMASLSGLFNSTSSLITLDIYRQINPQSSDRKLVLVGRLTTLILLFCAILLIPLAQSLDLSMCIKLFKIFSYLSTMTAAIFIVGLISQKIGATSAILTLVVGTMIILTRSMLEILGISLSNNNLLNILLGWNFFEFSIVIFISSVLLMYLINGLEYGFSKIQFIRSGLNGKTSESKARVSLYKNILILLSVLILIFTLLAIF
jgi:SSS family solute:Na+ symporter